MAEAKFSFSLSEGTFEVEGSETFVSAQIERFAEAIQANLKTPRLQPSLKDNPNKPGEDRRGGTPSTPNRPELDEIFAPTEDSVQILKNIPGDSKADKTLNAAKLYLYGLNALKQKDTALFEEIASVCQSHGFHDAANMSTNLKADKESFVFGGSGKKQTLKLTVPGARAAAKLVEQLRSAIEE